MKTEEQHCVEEEHENVEEKTSSKGYGLGHRHLQTFLIFQILAVSYIMRTSVSVAIVAMTDKSTNITNVDIYDWDKKTQDFVLSSFFWGYMLMQIPSGQLAQRFGAKKLLIGSMMVNGVCTLLFAQIIKMGGWQAACAVRALQGLTQSCTLPSLQIFLSKWAPVSERSRLGYLVMSGGSFGTIVSLPTVGFLAGRFGWHVSFQVIGVLALFTGAIWAWQGCDRPALHPKISEEERDYIHASLGTKPEHKVLKTPWKALSTSVPFWILVVAQVGVNWGYLTMLLETPSYLKLALGISSENSGLYSALPYIAKFFFGFVISFLSDFLINSKILSITVARKACNTIGCAGLGFGVIIMTYIPVDQVFWSIFMLTMSSALSAGFTSGIMLNPVDLAPNFAGTLMAIGNAAANAVGTLAPISVGYILKDPNDITQWRIVFGMICVIMNGSNLLFILFGTSEVQTWNEPEDEEEYIEMPETSTNKDAETSSKLLKP